MDKDKINIDQFFKTPLQNFEGNADDAMFDAIKKKVDASKVSDTPKVSVDNYFKEAMLGLEGNADAGMFEAIKSKVDASKVTVDNYFKEALLDYNSDAASIPFINIQNKLDRESVIDQHFKNALQNYEGNARDAEFAVIRKRVLQLQQIRTRKRYAWLLLLLLIPAWFMGSKYFNRNNNSATSSTINSGTGTPELKNDLNSLNNASSGENRKDVTDKSVTSGNKSTSNSTVTNSNTTNNNSTNNNNGTISASRNNENTNTSSAQNNTGANTSNANTSPSQENNTSKNGEVSKKEPEPAQSSTEVNKEIANKDVKVKEASEAKETSPNNTSKVAATNIRKPKLNYTVQVFGAASCNGRYLNADTSSRNYLVTRNASDKITTKFNFGIDLLHQVGRFNVGIGLHENQFGQKGSYLLTKNIHDTKILWHDSTHTKIDAIFLINFRDTSFNSEYNNVFTSMEIPLQFSYRICKASKVDVEVGMGVIISYISSAKGAIPNATSSEVFQIKDAMHTINRFGSAGTASMKVNYNLTSKWQVGTELYLRSSMTSLYKKNTGINELPYSAGMRCGIGYKF